MAYTIDKEEHLSQHFLHVWCPYTGREGRVAIEKYMKASDEELSEKILSDAEASCCLGDDCPKAQIIEGELETYLFCGGNWQG